jgi:hypothetical protein
MDDEMDDNDEEDNWQAELEELEEEAQRSEASSHTFFDFQSHVTYRIKLPREQVLLHTLLRRQVLVNLN